GRTVDTYPYDHSTMPSFYNNDDNKYTNVESIVSGYGKSSNFGYYQYEEGIYVGYRYYETADKEGYFDSSSFNTHAWKNGTASGYSEVVQYPFGYGLSYTTFEEKVTSSNIPLQAGGNNSITINVTNTGSVDSKQVVELYLESPYDQDSTCGIKGVGLEKSSKVLVGFKKTQTIKAGESQDVTINFDTDDLASFDNYGHGCYVLEKGDYQFHIGLNAHEDACSSISKSLGATYVYDETGVGKRSSDKAVAKVSLSDVDAGDGNMLDGYLSRSNFSSGMTSIMSHESSCKTEALSASGVAALGCGALQSVDYTYSTYENGEKVQKTIKKYVGGSSYQSYSSETNYEGLTQDDDRYFFDDANEEHVIDYGAKYYVEVDDSGNAKKDEYGEYIVTENETSMPLDVNCSILKTASYDDEIWAYLADETTFDEQITVQGGLGWCTPAVASVGKEKMSVVDGPGEAGNGNNSYSASTWFTSAVVNASTWNPALIEKMGEAYAHQSKKNGLGGAYCPAMNTHRSPYGGRNFEYYSEDGFIGGKIGAAEVSGIQGEGIIVFIKHMAFNDNDTNRDGNITWFSEQAGREIYLKNYEIATQEVFVPNEDGSDGEFKKGEGALGIMASLNRDGISWSHQGLYKNILRNEWGFNGLIITDGVGPYPWIMTPGAGLFGGVEGQLGGSEITTYYSSEGNASTTNYGKYLLRQCMKHMLYQNCHAAQVSATSDTSWRGYQIALNVVCGLGIGAIAIFLILIPCLKKDEDDSKKEVK
ncbi:MAG: glycoside hydrolase family 3 N-terminal domain-containing protein, partial [Bacilli bacterium]